MHACHPGENNLQVKVFKAAKLKYNQFYLLTVTTRDKILFYNNAMQDYLKSVIHFKRF